MTKKGKLTISREKSRKFEIVNLELTDDRFRMLFRAEITLADFASAITGMGMVPCDYKVWDRTEV